jgi:hypothetical protein
MVKLGTLPVFYGLNNQKLSFSVTVINKSGHTAKNRVWFFTYNPYLSPPSMKTAQQNIKDHLILSQNTSLAIHIKLKSEKTFFITCVEQIAFGRITVNPVSLHGAIISTISFDEADIEVAKCLNVNYNSPFYTHLRAIKANIRIIKDQVTDVHRRA